MDSVQLRSVDFCVVLGLRVGCILRLFLGLLVFREGGGLCPTIGIAQRPIHASRVSFQISTIFGVRGATVLRGFPCGEASVGVLASSQRSCFRATSAPCRGLRLGSTKEYAVRSYGGLQVARKVRLYASRHQGSFLHVLYLAFSRTWRSIFRPSQHCSRLVPTLQF